jgi:hypothetical protein
METITIILGVLSASYSIHNIFDINEKIRFRQLEHFNALVKESVEHAYITYIYEIKQQCKKNNQQLEYDTSKANEIATTYFYNNYSRPFFDFNRLNNLKINKQIRDELRFFRAKNTPKPLESIV